MQVRIYLTHGRKIITAVRQWSKWQGENDVFRAGVHDSPADALAWLVQDNDSGRLGKASKEAWEAACAAWSGLDGEDVERVD